MNYDANSALLFPLILVKALADGMGCLETADPVHKEGIEKS